MMNRPALNRLNAYIKTPSQHTLAALIVIPTINNVLCFESKTGGKPLSKTHDLLKWIYGRGSNVMTGLLERNGDTDGATVGSVMDSEPFLSPESAPFEEKPWRQVESPPVFQRTPNDF